MKKSSIFYVLIIATIVRLLSINQSLWLDETTTALTTQMSVQTFFNSFLVQDFHPPLYYLLLKGWAFVFGTSEISLRIPSVVFAVLTIYVIYKIGLLLKRPVAAISGSLLVSLSGLHIYYSQEARMYSLAALFVSLFLYFSLQFFIRKQRIHLFQMSLISILIFLTDYVAMFIVPSVIVLLLMSRSHRKQMRWLFAAYIPFIVVFALFWPVLSSQLSIGSNISSNSVEWSAVLGKVNFKNILLIPIKFMIGRIGYDSKIIYALVIVVGFAMYSIALSSIMYINKNKRKEINFLICIILITLLLVVCTGFIFPIISYFRLLFLIPIILLLVGIGLEEIPSDRFLPLLLLLIVFNSLVSYRYLSNYRFWREDWRWAANYIRNESINSSSAIVFPAESQKEAFSYYIPGIEILRYGDKPDQETIWLMRYVWNVVDPQDKSRIDIESSGYHKVSEHNFNGVVVWKYIKS